MSRHTITDHSAQTKTWWATPWSKCGELPSGCGPRGGVLWEALTLQYREKVQECADFLVVTVTDRLELVSTFTPSR